MRQLQRGKEMGGYEKEEEKGAGGLETNARQKEERNEREKGEGQGRESVREEVERGHRRRGAG